jgi:hypothetical protein
MKGWPLALVLLVTFIAGCVVGYNAGRSPSASTLRTAPTQPAVQTEGVSGDAVQPSANQEATPAGTPTAREIFTTQGTGSKNTATFVIPPQAKQWVISWKTQPERTSGHFSIVVHREDGRYVDLVANVSGASEDESVMRGAGAYYLEISALQPYSISVHAMY